MSFLQEVITKIDKRRKNMIDLDIIRALASNDGYRL